MRRVTKPENFQLEKKQLELTNLRLVEEKLRQELVDLRRPYLFRNPQLLTALITSVGAIIGVTLLISENYFKTREQLNTIQAEKTIRLNAEAREAGERAERARNDAAHIIDAARSTEAIATKTVAESNKRIAIAKIQLVEARNKLDRTELIVASQDLASRAEEEVRAGDHEASLDIALKAWRKSRTAEAKQAIVHAYTLPVKLNELLVTRAAFSPDGKRILTVASGIGPCLWESSTGKLSFCLKGILERVGAICYSPDGRLIAVAYEEGRIALWDAASGRLLRTFEDGEGPITFSRDSKYLAMVSSDHTVRILDVSNGRQLLNLIGHTDRIYSIEFSDRGSSVLTVGSDATLRLWDGLTGKQLWQAAISFAPPAFFSPNGRRIFVVNGVNTYVLDAESGKRVAELIGRPIGPQAFSRDGRCIVTAIGAQLNAVGKQNEVRMWDAESGKPLESAEFGNAERAWFTHDGQILVTSGYSGIRAWDAASGKLLTSMIIDVPHDDLTLPYGPPPLIIVSLDGDRVAIPRQHLSPDYTAVYQIVTADAVERLFP